MKNEVKQGGVLNCVTVNLWIAIVAAWRIVLPVLCVINLILAWIFVLPPMFERRIADHFMAVLFIICMPFAEGGVLLLVTALEVLAENVLECILPLSPRKGGNSLRDTALGTLIGLGGFAAKEVAGTVKEVREIAKLSDEELNRRSVTAACEPLKAQLEIIVQEQQSAGYKMTAREKRHLWYALQEFWRIRRRRDYLQFSTSALEYVYGQCPELFTGMTPKEIMQEFSDFHYELELDESKDYNEGWNRRMLCQTIGRTLVEGCIKGGDIDKQYRQLYAAMEALCPGENI